MPLARKTVLGKTGNPRFNPSFRIGKNHVALHPLAIVSVANEQLGEYPESLDDEGRRIMDAPDELLTQAWR